jgi:hypothetical protein
MSFPVSSAASSRKPCPSADDDTTIRKKARLDKKSKREIQTAPPVTSRLPARFIFASHVAPFQFSTPPAGLAQAHIPMSYQLACSQKSNPTALQQNASPFTQSPIQQAAAAAGEPECDKSPSDTDDEELCMIFGLPFTPKEPRADASLTAPSTGLACKKISKLQPQAAAYADQNPTTNPLSSFHKPLSHQTAGSSQIEGYAPFLLAAGFAPQVRSEPLHFDGVEGFAPQVRSEPLHFDGIEDISPLCTRWDYQKNTDIGLTLAQAQEEPHMHAFWLCVNHVHSLWMSTAEVLSAQQCPMCLGSSY